MPQPFVVAPRGAPASGEAGTPAVESGREAPRPALGGLPVSAWDPVRVHLGDPEVTDIFINGEHGLFVDRGRGAEQVPHWHATESEVREIATGLIARGGRHIDDATPCVDVRLEQGVRVHAVLPPVSADGTTISIRVPRGHLGSLAALREAGMIDASSERTLQRLVEARENLLVTGAAGSGKTTLLAALLSSAPEHERIVTIEDVAELRIRHPHHVRLESRQANLEGAGGIDLARLVREALRMRPDRLVVGECRGAEVRELLTALNTGHDGGAGTLHANGLDDVPARLEALGALAGLDDTALARQVVSAIGVVIHVIRDEGGVRRVAGTARPVLVDGHLGMERIPWG
jgi:pilus assembly protein CpaF